MTSTPPRSDPSDHAAGDGCAIADYGFLSDCSSASLVSSGGSIDWLCLPRLSATLDIRRERPADRDAVRNVNRAAFVDPGAHVAGLVEALRDLISVDRGVSLVAVESHEVIGHVKFTPSLLDGGRLASWVRSSPAVP